MKSPTFSALLVALGGFLFLGDAPAGDITILRSAAIESVAYEQGDLLLVSALKQAGDSLTVGRPWMREILLPLDTKARRDAFAKDFFKIVPGGSALGLVSFTYRLFAGFTQPESLRYQYADTVSLRAFWQRKEFAGILQSVQNPEISEVHLIVRGWNDTTLATAFDDPVADSRFLYKIHLRLLPGANRVYLFTPGHRSSALEYDVTVVAESNPVEGRAARFHGSEAESGCLACHEGTPSAAPASSDNCATCHRSLTGGDWKHAPAEMNQCESCHTWSAEKRAVIVAGSVPGSCMECHLEKKTIVDSASVVHPITSDCTACHSPHSADVPHLLKQGVFELCTACHEKYTLNHPVGKHPVRFARVAGTGAEISCVSCHDPHGNNTPGLLRTAGGPMEICMDCHTR